MTKIFFTVENTKSREGCFYNNKLGVSLRPFAAPLSHFLDDAACRKAAAVNILLGIK